jgi:hypothetical protein
LQIAPPAAGMKNEQPPVSAVRLFGRGP